MAAPTRPRIVGRISLHPRGFGFLTADDGEISAFVAPPDLNPFLEGDRVRATLQESGDGRLSAHELELVERERREVYGTVVRHRGRTYLHVDRKLSNTDWVFAAGHPELRDGQWAVAEVSGKEVVYQRAIKSEEVGPLGVLVRWGIRHEPAAEHERAAALARPRSSSSRRDLRALPTVTIDGPETRDLDDALAVLPPQPDGALRVLVSISDVDAFAPAGSVLDEEARQRATSVYLPDRVVPMFPEALSTASASLVEGAERPALTVEMRIDPEGRVTAVDLYESLIRSHARLSYEAVAEFLDRGRKQAVPALTHEPLRWLRTAAARLGSVRAARGGLSFVREEARLELHAESGEPVGITSRGESVATLLVERLMVAANEAVGQWLVDRGLPGLFRVHDEPEPEQVERLGQLARNFGFEAGFGSRLTPKALAAFEGQYRSAAAGPSLETVLAEVIGPARYQVQPALHFGLGAPVYAHFTSPIRRYPDLVVHRIVKAHLAGRRDQLALDPELESLAEHVNRQGYRAAKAEAERRYMLTARLMAKKVGEKFEGNVVAIKPFGLVVQLVGLGITGTVAMEELPGGPYRLEAASFSVVGPKRGFTIGDELEVEILGADEELGRIELGLGGK